MNCRLPVVALIAAFVALQPVSAADPSASAATGNATAAPADKATKDKKDEPKKICHTEVPTGSIRPKRVCHTQAELDAASQQAQDQLDQMNRLRQQQTAGLRGG